jgi:adenosylhomocysteine nucleosidase
MICYAFPLEHEAAPFLAACTQPETFCIGALHCTLANLDDRRVLVARVGMGRARARAGAETIFAYFRPRAVILSGYGGALTPQLKVGQVVVSSNYCSKDVSPFLRLLSDFDFAAFCTTDEIAGTTQERDRLARSHDGQVAEMETAPVAEVVHGRGVPFVAVRVISDAYAQALPVGALAAGFDAERGRATPLRLAGRLALHRDEVKPFLAFVGGLSGARRKLAGFLRQVNAELPGDW